MLLHKYLCKLLLNFIHYHRIFNCLFLSASFIVQFLILSLVLGIPLLTLHVCLGQRLAAGSVDMWKISPLFQGVGIALLIAQAFIGIYSIVGVSWMFVYFRCVDLFPVFDLFIILINFLIKFLTINFSF